MTASASTSPAADAPLETDVAYVSSPAFEEA
jgi:hypothetical protein